MFDAGIQALSGVELGAAVEQVKNFHLIAMISQSCQHGRWPLFIGQYNSFTPAFPLGA